MKKILYISLFLFFSAATISNAVTKTSNVTNGNWGTNGTWSPSGVPTASDDVIISSGHTVTMNTTGATCKSITVSGTLNMSANKSLTIAGAAGLVINGTFDMNGSDIILSTNGAPFKLGTNSTFYWNPATNTVAAATLFTKGAEDFAVNSTLYMERWYDYTIGLGSLVTGNFGNLKLDVGGTWEMNNTLQTHEVKGTLSVYSGTVVLDSTKSISNTTIGNIILNGGDMEFHRGTHTGSFTVNTTSITINNSDLDGISTGATGNMTLNVSGNISNTGGSIYGAYQNTAGNATINIGGNLTQTAGSFFGVDEGNGNSTVTISGNLNNSSWGFFTAEFYGVVDGNGNSTVTISGNFTNTGDVSLVFNTGVAGTGNGNATMSVTGTYSQSSGDFVGILNATTYNSGTCNITVGALSFTGGDFYHTYSCSAAGTTNTLTINGNLTVAFTSNSDRFRGNGMGLLNTTSNPAQFNFSITGTTSIGGSYASAEFSSSVSYGTETVTSSNNTSISGGTVKFQNGPHAFTWNQTGNVAISGGTSFLSAEAGAATVNISGNLSISGSSTVTSLKGKAGLTAINVGGTFSQTAGSMYVYGNSSTAASDNVSLNITNDFTQSGGAISFSTNSSSTGVYSINLSGDDYTIGGTATMTTGSGTGTLFGRLNFNRSGTINFVRTGTHNIQQVKQSINSGTILTLKTGNLQVASSATAATDYLTVSGTLNAVTNKIYSNATAANSGMNIASGGTVKTANTYGWYDNSTNATLSNAGAMNFSLDPNSTIEYAGVDNQVVTGFGAGVATQTQHKYGILKINFTGTTDVEYTNLSSANTYVRTQLAMTAGELRLNDKMLIIENGATTGITRTAGYIRSETNNAINNSIVKWMSLTTGSHIFPFATSSTSYLPVSFGPTAGTGGYASISTRGTGSNNSPLTGISNVAAVTNLADYNGVDQSVEDVLDRWWVIDAPGITADLSLTYRGAENTTPSPNTTGSFALQYWNGTQWSSQFGLGSGVASGTGTITATGVSVFGPIIAVTSNVTLPIKLLTFEAKLNGEKVDLTWSTAEEKDNDYFTVERSEDGKNFKEVTRVKGNGNSNSVKYFSAVDLNPVNGKSYYRLKQTDFNGKYTYSQVRVINRNGKISGNLEILSAGPNPFTDQFNMSYQLSNAGVVKIMVLNSAGQIVYQTSRNGEKGSNSFEFNDGTKLSPGNYILNVISGTEKITRKLIKSAN